MVDEYVPGDLNVSAKELQPALYQGWGKKQGGSVKSWKRRWFVLKETRIWYFKGQASASAQGYIELDAATLVRDESTLFPGKRFTFSVKSRNQKGSRIFYIAADDPAFFTHLEDAVREIKPAPILVASRTFSEGSRQAMPPDATLRSQTAGCDSSAALVVASSDSSSDSESELDLSDVNTVVGRLVDTDLSDTPSTFLRLASDRSPSPPTPSPWTLSAPSISLSFSSSLQHEKTRDRAETESAGLPRRKGLKKFTLSLLIDAYNPNHPGIEVNNTKKRPPTVTCASVGHAVIELLEGFPWLTSNISILTIKFQIRLPSLSPTTVSIALTSLGSAFLLCCSTTLLALANIVGWFTEVGIQHDFIQHCNATVKPDRFKAARFWCECDDENHILVGWDAKTSDPTDFDWLLQACPETAAVAPALRAWCATNNVTAVVAVGREVGAEPKARILLDIPNGDAGTINSATLTFSFRSFPQDLLSACAGKQTRLLVVVARTGIVRLEVHAESQSDELRDCVARRENIDFALAAAARTGAQVCGVIHQISKEGDGALDMRERSFLRLQFPSF